MYEATTDEQSRAQLDALPEPALAPFAEARAALELAPWNGRPYHPRRPDSPMRTLVFGPHGEGTSVYLIVEDRCGPDRVGADTPATPASQVRVVQLAAQPARGRTQRPHPLFEPEPAAPPSALPRDMLGGRPRARNR